MLTKSFLQSTIKSINNVYRLPVVYTKPLSTYLGFQLPKRSLSYTAPKFHGHLHEPKKGEELYCTFVLKDGTQKKFAVCEGDSLLDIAQGHNLEMEGACGGSCACSTCHVIVDPQYIDKLPEPSDDEDDMLDLAYGLTETSRLGCCIKMNKEIDGIRVALPQMTRNVQSSDFE
ncbi:mitochondrial matrix iron-sulfur protein [Hanseniaspora osmophila]